MTSLWTPSACRAARAAMLDGIEGRLDAPARVAVMDHLAACAACAEAIADLAAAHHAASRALEPYRRARASVAPGRARLAAGRRPDRASRVAGLLAGLGRPPEHAVVFAVIALLFFGALPTAAPRADDGRAPGGASYVRAADDPGGLVRSRSLVADRIPVDDGLVIDLAAPPPAPVAPDRQRQGLRPSTAR